MALTLQIIEKKSTQLTLYIILHCFFFFFSDVFPWIFLLEKCLLLFLQETLDAQSLALAHLVQAI